MWSPYSHKIRMCLVMHYGLYLLLFCSNDISFSSYRKSARMHSVKGQKQPTESEASVASNKPKKQVKFQREGMLYRA